MEAKDIMTTSVITVQPDTPVEDIARTLLDNRISAVPVLDDSGRLTGIVSEGDLMRRADIGTDRPASWWLRLFLTSRDKAASFLKSYGGTAEDVMTRKLVTVEPETDIQRIAEILEERGIKRVPVVEDGKLVGIVSRANLIQGLVAAKPSPTPNKDDRSIRQLILDTIEGKARIESQGINVTVTGGKVFLWGSVGSAEEKQAAEAATRNVSGVQEVKNNLLVIPTLYSNAPWVT